MENKIHVPIQKPVIKCDKPTNMSLGGPQFNHPSSDGTIWSVQEADPSRSTCPTVGLGSPLFPRKNHIPRDFNGVFL